MAKNITDPNADLALASEMANRVKIEWLRLSSAAIKQNLVGDRVPKKTEFRLNATSKLDVEAKRIEVLVPFVFSATYEADQQPAEPAVYVMAEFLLSYSIDSLVAVTEEKVEAFGRLNGVYNAWPYWREFLQSTVVRLGLPTLTLPLLTISELLAIYKSQESETASGRPEGPPESLSGATPSTTS